MDEKKGQIKNKILRLMIRLVDEGVIAAMSGSTLKIYFSILRHRNIKGRSWPCIETIQKESGVKNRGAVFKTLSWLIACGLIEKKRGPKALNFVNIYTVLLEPRITIPSSSKKRYSKRKYENFKKERGVPKNGTHSLVPKSGTSLLSQKADHKEGKVIGSIIKRTTEKLSLKEKKIKKAKKLKIDTGEKAWNETFNTLEEKIKDKEEAKS